MNAVVSQWSVVMIERRPLDANALNEYVHVRYEREQIFRIDKLFDDWYRAAELAQILRDVNLHQSLGVPGSSTNDGLGYEFEIIRVP